MEDNGSFKSVAIDWLVQALQETAPARTNELDELRSMDRYLGLESDAGLRMKALGKRLTRNSPRGQVDPFQDARTREAARQVIEKLILLERRMTLGTVAIAVDRFKLHRDNKVSEYIKT